MNIFFYAGSCEKEEQQFAQSLLQQNRFADMVILPGGGQLVSLLSLNLRGGDILILCAASDDSFESLLEIQSKFEDFRIILVLHRRDDELIRRSHLLRPRYIASLSTNLDELDKVVEKMMMAHRNDMAADREEK